MKTTHLKHVRITESVDTEKLLSQLPIELRNKGMKEGAKKAAQVVAKAYKARIPKGPTGNLKASVTWKVKSYQGDTVVLGLVGARRPKGSHAHLIENDRRVVPRGPVGASNKKSDKKPKTGKNIVQGKRYLSSAVDTTTRQQEKAVIESLRDSIKKAGG